MKTIVIGIIFVFILGGIFYYVRENVLEEKHEEFSSEEKLEHMKGFFMKAHGLFKQERYKEALSQWEKVLTIDPTHEETKKYIARCREKIGEKSFETSDYETKGSLSEIYTEFNKATRKWDIKEMKKYVSAEKRKELDQFPENLNNLSEEEKGFVKGIMELMKTEASKDYEIIRQKLGSDKASLYLKKDNSDTPYGLVSFIKENGVWKIEKESWSNTSKD